MPLTTSGTMKQVQYLNRDDYHILITYKKRKPIAKCILLIPFPNSSENTMEKFQQNYAYTGFQQVFILYEAALSRAISRLGKQRRLEKFD